MVALQPSDAANQELPISARGMQSLDINVSVPRGDTAQASTAPVSSRGCPAQHQIGSRKRKKQRGPRHLAELLSGKSRIASQRWSSCRRRLVLQLCFLACSRCRCLSVHTPLLPSSASWGNVSLSNAEQLCLPASATLAARYVCRCTSLLWRRASACLAFRANLGTRLLYSCTACCLICAHASHTLQASFRVFNMFFGSCATWALHLVNVCQVPSVA